MTDLLLNRCGDIDITEGKLTIIRGADAVRQRWLVYIRTFLGEWMLDQSIGVPYAQRIFRKQITRSIIKQVFWQASLEVPGVLQVVSVVVDSLDTTTRFAEVTVTAVIAGDENTETGQLKYTGVLTPGGCPTEDNLVVYGSDSVFYGNEIVVN
jgi:hypothetical protein